MYEKLTKEELTDELNALYLQENAIVLAHCNIKKKIIEALEYLKE